jgi:shikimate kinase
MINSSPSLSSEISSSPKSINIYLIGLMGAGKTSVGRMLGQRLQLPFYDSDHEIERITGVKIPTIFEIEGEAGFRAREEKIIEQLTALDGIILATGGGAILSAQNRERLQSRGQVIYLCATPEDLWRRTRRDRNRPLLQTANPLAKLQELHQQRDPLYRSSANLIVDTGTQSLSSLIQHILTLIPKHSSSPKVEP